MRFLRTQLFCALPLLAACSMDDVPLEDLACPCAVGWVCVDAVCVREEDARDLGGPDGGPSDFGAEADLGSDVDSSVDAGEPDGGEPDGGPPDTDAAAPVDCSPLMARENTEFCAATRDSCSAEAYNMTTCDDLCAAAGLVCLEAYDDLNPGCGPNLDAPTTCDDATRMGYHCLCVRD